MGGVAAGAIDRGGRGVAADLEAGGLGLAQAALTRRLDVGEERAQDDDARGRHQLQKQNEEPAMLKLACSAGGSVHTSPVAW